MSRSLVSSRLTFAAKAGPFVAVDAEGTSETDLYGAFPVKGLFPPWLGSRSADCSFGFADSSLFGAGKAVLRPVACDQVPGARGRGQGDRNASAAWRLAALASLVFRSALTPEHTEGR